MTRLISEKLSCEILPEFGGKIASLVWRASGAELIQAPLGAYKRRGEHGGAGMPFAGSDAGGWDECLPSVAACQVDERAIPDHGDLWGVPWEVTSSAERELEMQVKAESLPLRLTRRMVLDGAELTVHYTVMNFGTATVPYLWSAHPLFAVEAGDRLWLPPEVRELRVEGSKHDRLGVNGDTRSWPLAQTPNGDVDLTTALGSRADTGDKVFARLEQEGWAEIERPSAGVRLRMEFDCEATPYLGLWLCYGGWPDGVGPRQQCIALEPTTAPCDSLAVAMQNGWARQLKPGERHHWRVAVEISSL